MAGRLTVMGGKVQFDLVTVMMARAVMHNNWAPPGASREISARRLMNSNRERLEKRWRSVLFGP